ncbi:MAG TPA: tetratricopeptide repeat protein [Terriglobia bacterium]|nr:tetratricopeptide repeat protein [Terriglobia bacterium]
MTVMKGMKGMVSGAALAFLLIGAGLGFASAYLLLHNRAAEIAKPLPMLRPRSDSADTGTAGATKPPPLDTARLKQLEDTVKADPKNIPALTELGNMQSDQLNYDEAAKWYKLAVDANPKNVEMRNYLGEALFQGGHADESLAAFKAALEVNPTHPEALFDYGYVLLQGKKDADGAVKIWEKLVQTNPNFDQIDRVKQLITAVKERTK